GTGRGRTRVRGRPCRGRRGDRRRGAGAHPRRHGYRQQHGGRRTRRGVPRSARGRGRGYGNGGGRGRTRPEGGGARCGTASCGPRRGPTVAAGRDRKSTRLNSSHVKISYAVFCLKKKK